MDSFSAKLDSTSVESQALLTVRNDAVIYTAINAIKQLDSSVSALQTNPGISGSGTQNFLAKWQNGNSVTNSQVFDDGMNVGVGTALPQNKLDVVRGAAGTMGKGTYESASIERNGDTKMGIYSSTASTEDGASLAFGFTSLTNNDGLHPGFEMQELYSSDPSQNIIRFNALERNSDGVVTGANPNIFNILGNGNIGIGTSNPSERLHVIGNILATGSITQNSDAKLKQNIDSINNALQIIAQLKPRSFNFDTIQYSYLGLPGGKQYGVIAQETETVLSEIVRQSVFPEMKDYKGNSLNPETKYKTVNYTALIPILIKAVQEQQAKILSLESGLNSCCSSNLRAVSPSQSIPSSNVELASASAVLYQNMPNPFGDGTAIRYFIPESSTAVMKFFDEFGNEIKSIELPYKGQMAEVNLATSNLANGVYSYSLIVNGRIIDTKRMIKTQ